MIARAATADTLAAISTVLDGTPLESVEAEVAAEALAVEEVEEVEEVVVGARLAEYLKIKEVSSRLPSQESFRMLT